MKNSLETAEVIIIGGGPTGLMLACELRLAGVSPVVLERLTEPVGFSKALGILGRMVDVLDHRGLLERFTAHYTPDFLPTKLNLMHFGLIPLDVRRLKGEPPKSVFIPQSRTEQLLAERARELGAEIRRGHELLGLRQDEDGVTVDVRGPTGEYQLRARFLVGCDGGRSGVRKLAGIAFPGLGPTTLRRLGEVKLPPEVLKPGYFPEGVRLPMFPLGDGYYRVVSVEPYPPSFDRSVPMTLDEFRESIRRTTGVDLPMSEPRWLTRFTDASRQAEQYRAGRVLLAGDAAHIHLPAGGPGLNTGLQDAVNLGWKLAAEVQGWAPSGLLDTYHSERHPVGQRVLMHTRAQGVLVSSGVHVPALRQLFAELLQEEDTLRHIVDLLQGTDIRYDMDGGGGERHPLLGQWAPPLELVTAEGRKRVPEFMHRARGVLIDLSGRAALRELAAGWTHRIDVLAARCDEEPRPADALLIRPDGYVAWVAAAGEPDDSARSTLGRALGRWFGAGKPSWEGLQSDSSSSITA